MIGARALRIAISALAAGILASVGVASAAGATADDGLWYFDRAHIGEHHSAGWTGEGVTIAILDSPINTSVPTLEGANVKVREPSFCMDESGDYAPAVSDDLTGSESALHGTGVTSVVSGTGAGYQGQLGVKGVAPGATVLYYAVTQTGETVEQGVTSQCLDASGNEAGHIAVNAAMNEAIDAGADIISISGGYAAGDFIDDAHIRALKEGVVILGGVANTDILAISMHWPSGGNGTVGVQAADADGNIQTTDGRVNRNIDTKVLGPGIGILTQGAADGSWEDQEIRNGTSLATPIVAGFLALVKQKYPDATGNQLIQTLIHNTWAEDHDLEFDPERITGYGYASATHMLRVDPTQYPDENPLIVADGIPTLEEITNWVPPAAEPTEEVDERPVGPVDDGWITIGIFVFVGFLVLMAIVALIVVLAIRKSRSGRPNGTEG